MRLIGTLTLAAVLALSAGCGDEEVSFLSPAGPPPNASPSIQGIVPSATLGFTGQPLDFSVSASDADGSITQVAWDFGDGQTGTGSAVGHTFGQAGAYTVTVTVTDNRGATAAETVEIRVSDIAISTITLTGMVDGTATEVLAGGTPVTVTGGTWSHAVPYVGQPLQIDVSAAKLPQCPPATVQVSVSALQVQE